jgi:hypothetical protein
MLDSLKAVLALGGEWLSGNARTLFAILRSPRSFVTSLDLDNDPPLLEASAFAIFISMVNLVIYLPVLRTIGVQAETVTFVLVDSVLRSASGLSLVRCSISGHWFFEVDASTRRLLPAFSI